MKTQIVRFALLTLALTICLTGMVLAAEQPDPWAQKDVNEAIALKLVPPALQNSYKSNITRQDFCVLLMTLIRQKTPALPDKTGPDDKPFTDTQAPEVIEAYRLGIVTGSAEKTFRPTAEITRQEAAVMLTRTAKLLGMDTTARPILCADADDIASWAKDSVHFVLAKQIMKGLGRGQFTPAGHYTRQQAIISLMRLYKRSGGTRNLPQSS